MAQPHLLEIGRTADLIARIRQLTSAPVEVQPPSMQAELVHLTDELSARRPQAAAQYERFLMVQRRDILLPEPVLDRFRGQRILVTGGTGCIGTALLRQLAALSPSRLVSVSRGLSSPHPRVPGVNYRFGDIRDADAMAALVGRVRPDIVFHLAAFRDPGRAQQESAEAITTNVLGTSVVVGAAVAAGATQFVYASTGKAVRFYSAEVYAATKILGEAMVMSAADELGVGVARFTHVVDNSLILHKLKRWMSEQRITLHDPEIAFYAQSATESAQLLMLGVLSSRGEPRLHCLREFGDYFDLLDLALGLRQRTHSRSAIEFTGFSPGYQSVPHPAQYDVSTLDEFGPLINSLESRQARTVLNDSIVALPLRTDAAFAVKTQVETITALAAENGSRQALGAALDAASREVLRATLAAAEPDQVQRMRRRKGCYPTQEHVVIEAALRQAVSV